MKSIRVILLPALLLLWVTPLSNAQARLREFHVIKGGFYLNDARNNCKSSYTDLVTIYNRTENILAITACNGSCWIGLSSCSWSNSDLVTYANITSPFNDVTRCCGVVNTSGTWDCVDCNSTQMYFMCYKIGNNQQSFNYTLVHQNKTWSEAQDYCREHHTDLVSIRNETENEQVSEASNFSFPFWIGLQFNNNSATWFDGGQSDFKPIKISSYGCFTFLFGGPWTRINSNMEPALCYKTLIHVSESNMSWDDAMNYCEDHYSGPLVIQSEDDQIETERELIRNNILGPVWVGLRQSRLFGFWTWTNGVDVGTWSNWTGGKMPEHPISEHCGALKEENGQYKLIDQDCRCNFTVLCETD